MLAGCWTRVRRRPADRAGHQLEPVHEIEPGFQPPASSQAISDPGRLICRRARRLRERGEPGIGHLANRRMTLEQLVRSPAPIRNVAHAQLESLEPAQDEKGIQRRQGWRR